MDLTRFDGEAWICDVQSEIVALGSPSPPPAPDPAVVAREQGAANKETAITQARLNAINETTPQGSVRFTESAGPDNTPQFSRTVTLSPDQQRLYDQNTKLGTQLNDLAIGQTERLQGHLDKPLNLDDANAVEGRLFDLASRRLDPRFEQERTALESRLANQGILRGSEAFNRAMEEFGQTKNDAVNSLLLSGRQQALGELLTERNQPINEITALMSGGQVSMPQFAGGAPQTGVAPTDVTGAFGMNQAAQNSAFQAKSAASAGNKSALASLAGTAAMAAAIF